ncbi:metal-dependent hydrolase [Chloroflexota bacterium]
MLVLGHTGITLGIAVLLDKAFFRNYSSPAKANSETPLGQSPKDSFSQNNLAAGRLSRLTFFSSNIDIRLLLIGSLLPDIIDKPLGHQFLRDTISNGRIFCHTLLFLILIALAGLYLYRSRGKTSLLTVSFGTFTHLVLDQMWRTPRTLFWPICGLAFDRADVSDWIMNIFHALITDPQVFIPELVGMMILAWFLLILVRKRKVFYFIKYGKG